MSETAEKYPLGPGTAGNAADLLLERAVEGLFVINHERKFIGFSDGCERLTGYARADVIGMDCQCHEATQCCDEHGRSLAGALCPGLKVFHGELNSAVQRMRIAHRSGETRWVETLYTPMHNESGEVIGVVGVMRQSSAPDNAIGMGAAILSGPAESGPIEMGIERESPNGAALDGVLLDVERREILAALRRAKGQRARAARTLGISRSRLYRRMEVLGIDPRMDL